MKPAGRAGWHNNNNQKRKKKNPFKNLDVCVVTKTFTIHHLFYFFSPINFFFLLGIVILFWPFSNGDEGSLGMTEKTHGRKKWR
jgi:hypothetical protein